MIRLTIISTSKRATCLNRALSASIQTKPFSTESAVKEDPKSTRQQSRPPPPSSSIGSPPPPPSSSSSSSSSSPPIVTRSAAIPLRHSRHSLPPVCIDTAKRLEWTQQIMESKPGTLFANEYQARIIAASRTKKKKPSSSSSFGKGAAASTTSTIMDPNSPEGAWTVADPVCQKVEYLLRGYAHSIAGTQWNRWMSNHITESGLTNNDSVEDDTDEAVEAMLLLMDRLQQEGYLYMQLRSDRLQELETSSDETIRFSQRSPSGILSSLNDFEQVGSNGDNGTIGGRNRDNQKDIEEGVGFDFDQLESDEDEDGMLVLEDGEKYMNDFAVPGPTVHMYDILFDTVACSMISGTNHVPTLFGCDTCFDWLGDVVGRHELDGGDEQNRNPHTRPTLQTFNSAIRIAANAPWSSTDHNDELDSSAREDALILAFGAFDAMSQSTILERNSATYVYLLQTIAKYFPPSQSRGNIARGMWQHALLQGVIDEGVMEAMVAANTPSNGAVHDDYIQTTIAGKVLKDLPHKWRRYSRVRRLHPNEATY